MMKAVGSRNHDRLSSKGVNVGKSVFPKNTYPVFVHGNTPGGLIDKKQQADPHSTTFGHPFDGGDYQSTATGKIDPPRTGHNVSQQYNPLTQNVPEIAPHERGTFFKRKVTPLVKTQFGASKAGRKSDTAFHPQAKVTVEPAKARSATPTEKVSKGKIPSFNSSSNLWYSQNHSFSKGIANPISGHVGQGRWSTIKRSVV